MFNIYKSILFCLLLVQSSLGLAAAHQHGKPAHLYAKRAKPKATNTKQHYVIVSPSSCPPSQPSGTAIGQSDASLSAANSGLQYEEYPNSQLTVQDDEDGPFFIDLSDPNAIVIAASDGDTLVLYTDGTFSAYVGSCEYQIVSRWHHGPLKLTSKAKKRSSMKEICNIIHSLCEHPLAIILAEAIDAKIGVCAKVGAMIGEDIGGRIGYVGFLGGPEVGLPATLIGTVVGRKFGPVLCEKAVDLFIKEICDTVKTCPTPSSSATTSATPTSSTTTSATATITADAIYVCPTDNCSDEQALGTAIFCCSGDCIDGSSIGNPGQCLNWANVCRDQQSGPPSCSSNQVMEPGSSGWPNFVDSGDGNCWAGDECQWQRNDWTWKCCDCPDGYISLTDGVCPDDEDPNLNNPIFPCVGCDPGYVLAGDAPGGYYRDAAKIA